jgi:hypothetical protein
MAADSRTAEVRTAAAFPASRGYEVDYFARKHGITNDQAEKLIKKHDPTVRRSMRQRRS